ncbi:MAG: hypothetical protein IPK22_15080 [Verrucomicrobiaceae bacterium]|nr:hypothetical protein [Verrucomicrobiaceae bacterium]
MLMPVWIPPSLNAGPGRVKVVYGVTEGTKFFVNRINIAGNNATEDKVIRREIIVAPGEELNTVKLNTSRTRLEQLQLLQFGGRAHEPDFDARS